MLHWEDLISAERAVGQLAEVQNMDVEQVFECIAVELERLGGQNLLALATADGAVVERQLGEVEVQ